MDDLKAFRKWLAAHRDKLRQMARDNGDTRDYAAAHQFAICRNYSDFLLAEIDKRTGENHDTTDFPTKPCRQCGKMDRPQYQGACNDGNCDGA